MFVAWVMQKYALNETNILGPTIKKIGEHSSKHIITCALLQLTNPYTISSKHGNKLHV